LTLQSEIQQISDAIVSRNKTIKVTQYKSDSDKKQASLEIDELVRKKRYCIYLIIICYTRNNSFSTDPKK
jgi:hypothetical protein